MACLGGSILFIEVVQQVTYTETVTADLVCICRADTFTSRTDLSGTFGSFVGSIQHTVGRQDQVCLLGNTKLFGQVVTTGSKRFGFLFEQ